MAVVMANPVGKKGFKFFYLLSTIPGQGDGSFIELIGYDLVLSLDAIRMGGVGSYFLQ